MSLRLNQIAKQVRATGSITVDQIASQFNVTVQTARRDLSILADAGTVKRVHGGAVAADTVTNRDYEERRELNSDIKQAIGKACAADIPHQSSLFMNIGTTTEAVSKHLGQHEKLLVVTNNINIGVSLAQHTQTEVVLTGGTIRRSDGGLVGLVAENIVNNFKFDIAVIGCSGIDEDGDLLDYDLAEIAVSRAIIRQARKTYVVADHSKFFQTPPVRITSLSEVSRLYTDAELSTDMQTFLRSVETEVVRVEL